MQSTPLYDAHIEAGARMVDFSGWELPINYGSQIEEHHIVRRAAGMFDVSHMTIVDIGGDGARKFLSHLLANDISRLTDAGKALYSCMLDESGGVIDDLICYFMGGNHYRLVVNAATRDKDLAWINRQAGAFDVSIDQVLGQAMIAIQGPEARDKTCRLLNSTDAEAALGLKPFSAARIDGKFFARTGYTGEDGFEVVVPQGEAQAYWNQLAGAGVRPCGLGARDTLRLEAGMNLYGQDMDETVTPLESGLGWTVSRVDGRNFVGRDALLQIDNKGVDRRLVGLVMDVRGVMRPGQIVSTPQGEGVITSGSFSPTLSRAIAFARVPVGEADRATVEVRNKWLDVRIVRPPFVRHGQPCDGVV